MDVLLQVVDSFKWLTVYEWALCLLDVVILVWYAIPIRLYGRWLDFLPAAGLLIVIASLLDGDTTIPAILLDTLTIVLFACTAKKLWKPLGHMPVPAFRLGRVLLCVCGLIPLGVTLTLAGELRYNPVSDFSELSYSEAFTLLNERLSREYPFGEWKNSNWQHLQETYAPIFKRLEQEKNSEKYYKTLRAYVFSLRDAHSTIVNEHVYDNNPVFAKEVGGGFGLSTMQLDDGSVRVDLLLAGSPAEKSGIRLGAQIVQWDGTDANHAYENTSWSESPSATEGDRRFNQGRFLVRAPIGKRVQVAYKNPGEQEVKHATLTAYDDQFATLKQTRVKPKKEDLPLEAKRLPNGYGYVKIRYFLPSEAMPYPEKALEANLQEFEQQAVKGVILDVRDNPGGSDDMVADIAGFFVPHEKLYENVSYYNRYTRTFSLNTMETRMIKPAGHPFTGHIAILVNNRTISSGEGLPLALKGLPHVTIVGFTTTNGSFGVVSSPIQVMMPEGYLLQFPDGRSLDSTNKIQGDSNGHGLGGASPDVKVPLNEITFHKKVVEGEDVELQYAVEALERMK